MLLRQSALYEVLSFQSPLSAFFVSKMRFLTSTTKISLVLLLILCWSFDFREATRNFFSSLFSSRLGLVINLYTLSLTDWSSSAAYAYDWLGSLERIPSNLLHNGFDGGALWNFYAITLLYYPWETGCGEGGGPSVRQRGCARIPHRPFTRRAIHLVFNPWATRNFCQL